MKDRAMATRTVLFTYKAILRRFASDRSGVGAVEFAIIVPILLMIYITAFELTIGFSVAKRATHAAGSIADLVTQKASVDKAYLQTMKHVSAAILVPHDASAVSLKVSGIKIDATGKATYFWSWADNNTRPYAVGAIAPIPNEMNAPNSFLIHSELSIPHELLMFMPGLMPSTVKTISINRDYYFRQRQGTEVPCTNC